MATQGKLFDRYWRFCQLSGPYSIRIVLPHVSFFQNHFPILFKRLRDGRIVHIMFGIIPKNTSDIFRRSSGPSSLVNRHTPSLSKMEIFLPEKSGNQDGNWLLLESDAKQVK
jgi:hypothetical protein